MLRDRSPLTVVIAIAIALACGLVAIALAGDEKSAKLTPPSPIAGNDDHQPPADQPPLTDKLTPAPRRTQPPPHSPIDWRNSSAIGQPEAGRLERGVRFPAQGRTFFTWDPVLKRSPDRDWRRWGTDDLVRTTLAVLRDFERRHPNAPRVGVGDLSLPDGGDFGAEVSGGIGHATHQNGLDVDVYYPRLDRRERPPRTVAQVDIARAQALVDLFVDAGATTIYVGPNLPLQGPPGTVVALVNHDNHLHARIAP